MIRFVLLVAAFMALSVPSGAQRGARLDARSKVLLLNKGNATRAAEETWVSAYLSYDGSSIDWAALDKLGVKTMLKLGETATARIPLSKLAEIAEVRGVIYIQASTPVRQMLDKARTEAGVSKEHTGTDLSKAFTGHGVVVGIVDAGFDYSHAAFYDKNHNLRIKRVWEQNSNPADHPQGNFKSPEKFGYGIELTSQEDIENAGGDITDNSHGTHVANIVAGSDEYMEGAFKGTAPNADIVLVSMGEASRDNVNLTNALAYIFDYAEQQGKPCVINLSLGNHAGPHDGTSTFDVVADQLAGKGKLIVGAAGNHRADKFHIARSFSSAEDSPICSFIQYKTMPSTRHKGGDIEIWGSLGMEYEVELLAYSINNKTAMKTVKVYPSEEEAQAVTFDRYASGSLNVAAEVSPLNGKPHVIIMSDIISIRNGYALALKVTPKKTGQVDIWADNIYLELSSRDIEGFSEPDASSSTIAEIGGTANRILSVGAYTTRNEYTLYGETASRTLEETEGSISSFSSYGPTADGRVKPEVTAPGCFIISAVSSNDNSGTQLLAQSYSGNSRDYRYGYMQGTSMSSPFVAGVVATWLEANPELTPEDLHSVVKKTARKSGFTDSDLIAGGNSWGYGKIDAFEGLKECLNMGAGINTMKTPFEGTVIIDGENISITFAAATHQAHIGIYAANGSCAASKKLEDISTDCNTSIGIRNLPAGIYLLCVRTDKGMETFKFRK